MLIDAGVDRCVYPGAGGASSTHGLLPPWLRRLHASGQPCLFAPYNSATPSARLYVVLHGNNDSFESWHDTRMLPQLSARLRSDCLLLSYAGYAHCAVARGSGAARDAHVVQTAVNGVRDAQRGYNSVWLFGHSLGAAVALQCCTRVRPAGLVLVSPFASLASAAHRQYGAIGAWAAGDRFNSIAAARSHVRCPVVLLHGSRDELVPPEESRALFDALPANSLKHRYMLPAMQHALAAPHLALVAERVHQHYPPPTATTASVNTGVQFA